MKWETVIGLEVHTELLTESKIFCSCSTRFGAEPNTQICEVCTGMPGTLPLLNKKVVEFAVRTGLATNCNITQHTRFDRKNYFYPDLPKAYQISQLYLPICRNGFIEIDTAESKKRIGIHEIHMEEDAGKLIHDRKTGKTLIDYNRCGVPLLEIVSEPDFRSSEEVVAYLEKLRRILTYIGVSDCKMQEGSLRADVNLSVRKEGDEKLGTRTEMKNLNSFKEISAAIEYERDRQIKLLESGQTVVRQTRRWDAGKGVSVLMRSKEEAEDYRYFPEPDIPSVTITDSTLESVRSFLPELPDEKVERYITSLGMSEYDTSVITDNIHLARFFEKALEYTVSPKEAANWITGEVLRLLKDSDTSPECNPLSPKALADTISMVRTGMINRSTGKAVLEKVFYDSVEPEKYVKENSLMQLTDLDEIKEVVRNVLSENPKSVSDYKGGKQNAITHLIGQSMKALRGKAPADKVRRILEELLN